MGNRPVYFHGVIAHTSVRNWVSTPSLREPWLSLLAIPSERLPMLSRKLSVDYPEEVQVHSVEGQEMTVLEFQVRPEDLGRVISRHRRTAAALRTILGAAGRKLHKRVTVETLDSLRPT
jgi:predicted RNA-binding protein YlqC (UPF0109 family)